MNAIYDLNYHNSMKKILFRKLLFDCLIFFSITLISTGIIIWVFQAVNFLDIMVEDGRDYLVYINYSLLNFPKIIFLEKSDVKKIQLNSFIYNESNNMCGYNYSPCTHYQKLKLKSKKYFSYNVIISY